jgi:hypothetical protein
LSIHIFSLRIGISHYLACRRKHISIRGPRGFVIRLVEN